MSWHFIEYPNAPKVSTPNPPERRGKNSRPNLLKAIAKRLREKRRKV